MELTINGQVYQFNFGMGFMKEMNKKVSKRDAPKPSRRGIPVLSLWREIHEFSGNVKTAYHRFRVNTSDFLSDPVVFTASWYDCLFWTPESF